MLELRLEELSSRLRNRENITVERTPDVLDDIELSVERDLAIWSLDRGFAQLRYVTAALDRIADGTYGRCLRCDEEINMKRLTAVPYASFCIKCQEDADHRESRPCVTPLVRFGAMQQIRGLKGRRLVGCGEDV
jgi:DnaK suppressor protein